MNKSEDKNESGLPDVAELGIHKRPVLLSILVVVMAIVIGSYFFTGSNKAKPQTVEESYTVQSVPEAEIKKDPEPVSATTVAATAPVTPQESQEVIQQQVALIQEKQKELQQRLSAPLMVVNGAQAGNSNNVTQPTKTVSGDANTQFLNQVSAQTTDVSTATKIGPLNSVIAEGSLIHAILETASDSDLPGYLRASVNAPVYSEDGTQVLIPPGSRLIGQYKSGMLQGQSRIYVVWSRLITPTGISMSLGSPGVDSLGVAGMDADEINRHFWARFGSAALLSMIGAGAANVGVNGQDQNNSASSYREAVATSFAQSADQALQQDSRIAPTLKTYQGKPIMVYVARDLNFQSAIKQVKPAFHVF